jgi:tetratricopeptide (TPR) repeat protein
MYLGHSEDGVAGVERALRLSPHDFQEPIWQVHLCYLHNHLAQWEQSIEWCERALANNVREREGALGSLATAYAWAGHDKEAKEADAELRKLDPSLPLQSVAGTHPSDDPDLQGAIGAHPGRPAQGWTAGGVSGRDSREGDLDARQGLPLER